MEFQIFAGVKHSPCSSCVCGAELFVVWFCWVEILLSSTRGGLCMCIGGRVAKKRGFLGCFIWHKEMFLWISLRNFTDWRFCTMKVATLHGYANFFARFSMKFEGFTTKYWRNITSYISRGLEWNSFLTWLCVGALHGTSERMLAGTKDLIERIRRKPGACGRETLS